MLQALKPSDLLEELQKIYSEGMPPGDSTGWQSLDQFYTVAPGYFTVITGIPSHGKSTWVDCMMLQLMEKGWKFIVYSPENQPHALHLANLCEKLLQKPFRKGYYGRMEPADLAEAMDFFEDSLCILRFDDGQIFPTLESFMMACEEQIKAADWQRDKVGCILDCWNELDHHPIGGMTETQQTNHELMRYRQWIRRMKTVHGFIVAHPAKPQKDKYGELKDVTLYDISGSSAFKNKADAGIVVRRRDDHTIIDVEKIRFRHHGKHGQCQLVYYAGTQTFDEPAGRRDEDTEDDDR